MIFKMLSAIRKNLSDGDRLVWTVAVGLLVLCIGLLAITVGAGPRLRTVEVQPQRLVVDQGQKIVLRANQPLAKVPANDVRVEPAADVAVTTLADTVTITSRGRLAYDTDYHLTVRNITGQTGGKQVTFTHRFRTPPASFYYVQRHGSFVQADGRYGDRPVAGRPDDIIYKAKLGGGVGKVAYRAPAITAYAVLDKYLVVAMAESSTTSKLVLVDKQTGQPTAVALPEPGIVRQLQASPDGHSYGFALTSADVRRGNYGDSLLVHDTSPGKILAPLSGIAGRGVSVLDWRFAPDGTSVVAHQRDGGLLLNDGTFRNQPVPLGGYQAIGDFLANGTSMVAVDREQGRFGILDLLQRRFEPLAYPPALADGQSLLSLKPLAPVPTGGEARWLAEVQTGQPDGRTYAESLQVWQGRRVRQLVGTDQVSGGDIPGIGRFTASPNGQFVAYESAPSKTAEYDAYPEGPLPVNNRTLLVDTATGQVSVQLAGSQLLWDRD